jgi:hypothetical protein
MSLRENSPGFFFKKYFPRLDEIEDVHGSLYQVFRRRYKSGLPEGKRSISLVRLVFPKEIRIEENASSGG